MTHIKSTVFAVQYTYLWQIFVDLHRFLPQNHTFYLRSPNQSPLFLSGSMVAVSFLLFQRLFTLAFGDTAHTRHSSNKFGSTLAYSQRSLFILHSSLKKSPHGKKITKSQLALRADTAPIAFGELPLARLSSNKFGSPLAYSAPSEEHKQAWLSSRLLAAFTNHTL